MAITVPMTNAWRTSGARLVTASLATVLLAACGGTSTSSTAPSGASSPGAAAGAAGVKVGVVEKEFAITLDRASFSPATTYTFAIQNQGRYPHNLKIEGPGVDSVTSPTMTAGQSGSLTVTLQQGTYEVWCGIPGHKDKGMHLSIKVA